MERLARLMSSKAIKSSPIDDVYFAATSLASFMLNGLIGFAFSMITLYMKERSENSDSSSSRYKPGF